MVEERQERAKPLADAAEGRNVVAVRVPRARARVVAEVERHEGHAGLDQSPGQEGLLAPEVLAVAVAALLRLLFDVERLLHAPAEHQLHGLPRVGVHRGQRAVLVQIAAQAVEAPQQRAAVVNSLVR